MALFSVLLALVLLGALVAAGFYAALLEQRLGRHSLEATKAAEAAEAGLAQVAGNWESYPELSALAVTAALGLPSVTLATGQVVQAEGTATDAAGNSLARRVIARLVRVDGAAVVPLKERSWVAVY
jgi:Tfp pilus assembly protein PilX